MMVRIKNHEMFVEKVYSLIGNEYEFLTKYESAKTKIKVKHNKCNAIYDATPDHITGNAKKGKFYCPDCNGGIKYSEEKFMTIFNELANNEYIILSDYVDTKKYIKVRHNNPNCMYEYNVRPSNFIRGDRCPKCAGKQRKTTEEFKQFVSEKEGNDYIVLGEYTNLKTPIKIQHNIENCNHIFEITPNKFIYRNQRCPVCSTKSKGEIEISKLLNKLCVEFKRQYKFNDCKGDQSYVLRFDFGIIKENKLIMLIEYDGIQHFEPQDFGGKGEELALEQFKKTQQYDQIKNTYCKENNIPLYRISYWKFNEIESILNKLIHNEQIEVDETSFLVL